MFAKLPGLIRIPLAMLLLALNILLHVVPLFAFTLVKVIVPVRAVRLACSRVLVVIAESWIGVNNILFGVFTRIRWWVEGLGGLRRDGNYLVLCNHQSWVDIPVLQKVFNRHIPFLRFFLKSQLIWVPLLGPAWWALDFPFMKRYSKETLLRHPELQGKDREATRRACEKFRHMPVSVMNFVEGTPGPSAATRRSATSGTAPSPRPARRSPPPTRATTRRLPRAQQRTSASPPRTARATRRRPGSPSTDRRARCPDGQSGEHRR